MLHLLAIYSMQRVAPATVFFFFFFSMPSFSICTQMFAPKNIVPTTFLSHSSDHLPTTGWKITGPLFAGATLLCSVTSAHGSALGSLQYRQSTLPEPSNHSHIHTHIQLTSARSIRCSAIASSETLRTYNLERTWNDYLPLCPAFSNPQFKQYFGMPSAILSTHSINQFASHCLSFSPTTLLNQFNLTAAALYLTILLKQLIHFALYFAPISQLCSNNRFNSTVTPPEGSTIIFAPPTTQEMPLQITFLILIWSLVHIKHS